MLWNTKILKSTSIRSTISYKKFQTHALLGFAKWTSRAGLPNFLTAEDSLEREMLSEDSVSSGVGSGVCIPNQLPGAACAAGPQAPLEVARVWTTIFFFDIKEIWIHIKISWNLDNDDFIRHEITLRQLAYHKSALACQVSVTLFVTCICFLRVGIKKKKPNTFKCKSCNNILMLTVICQVKKVLS